MNVNDIEYNMIQLCNDRKELEKCVRVYEIFNMNDQMRCMMMKETKSMCWNVKYFNYNAKQVEDYNVLAYMKDRIKELKKKYNSKKK